MEQTVVKALALLEALVHAAQPQRLTDLAVGLGMTKPNVYRLLGTLSELGYVQQDVTTSLYRPTLKVYELGTEMVGRADLLGTATPILRQLCDQAHESVQLAVFDSGYVVYVLKFDSSRPLKAFTAIGSRAPASCVSTGKAILAWLPDSALETTLPLLKKFTAHTRLTRRAVERDLAETRQQGYAVNHGEWRPGIGGIGAPVRDWLGNVVASVGIWGPEDNILGARRKELATLAMAAANEVSRQLGYLQRNQAAPDVPAPKLPARGAAADKRSRRTAVT